MKGKHAVLILGALFLLTGGGLLVLVLSGGSDAIVPRQGVRPIEAHALPDPESAGAKILATRCVDCHAIPDPASHSPESWPPTLRRMSQLTAARYMPALTAVEAQTLEAYLVTHATAP